MLLKATMMDKQKAINIHIDKIAEQKQELEKDRIETEQVDKKLISYSTASSILDHILPKLTRKDESQEEVYWYGNKGLGYHRVPPPMKEGYSWKKPEGVEKALNLKLKIVQTNQIDQLPNDIDVTCTISDDGYKLELVKEVVEKVLENESDSTKDESSKSHFEDDKTFHKNIFQNPLLI
ncbi:hypothetical protein Hanom_Chr12g01120201 [Helianthus anomalus]